MISYLDTTFVPYTYCIFVHIYQISTEVIQFCFIVNVTILSSIIVITYVCLLLFFLTSYNIRIILHKPNLSHIFQSDYFKPDMKILFYTFSLYYTYESLAHCVLYSKIIPQKEKKNLIGNVEFIVYA